MAGETRSTKGKIKISFEDRFWSKVNKKDQDECWVWQGAKEAQGYGKLATTGAQKGMKAHQASYKIHFGEIPKGLCVCHKCDNPPCVNPNHLFLGTHAENMRDKVLKGREYDRRGEKNPNVKITWKKVAEVIRLVKSGKTQVEVAGMFDLSQNAVSRIVSGKSWRK